MRFISIRTIILWAGWLFPSIMIYGPGLMGNRILIPADLLGLPGYYLPASESRATRVTSDAALTDLVLIYPMVREFCAAEFRAGRIPHWQPQNYCGTPFVWPKYSPFELLYTAFPFPATLAWMELLQSLCVGTGTWWFLTRSLKYNFWPASAVSWCVPWIGFFTIWRGFPLTGPVCFLPWLLWSVDLCARHPFSRRTVSASIFTAFVLITGAPDIAGLVLLTSGLRFVWISVKENIVSRQKGSTGRSLLCMTLCWFIGFLLAAPYLLPFIEFARTGSRMVARAQGSEERPPAGLSSLPGLVVPEIYGGSRSGSPYLGPSGNLLESSAGGYAGLFLMLLVVPLAFANSKRRSESGFWLLLALVSAGWTIDLPGVVGVLRLPGFNMLSYNRWTFATAFSLLMLGCAGLEYLHDRTAKVRPWFVVPSVLAALAAIWCFYSAWNIPEPLRTILPDAVRAGRQTSLTTEDLTSMRRNYTTMFLICGGISLLSLGCWVLLMRHRSGRAALTWAVPVILVAELMYFAKLQIRESEPRQYFPRVPALVQLSEDAPGRILGLMCLPPNLNKTHNLSDVRGYDAIDSMLITRLLTAVKDPDVTSPRYAATQWYVPQLLQRDDGTVYLPPLLSMLNTRYLVMRNEPSVSWRVVFHQDDYWVIENPDFLPRAFVPSTVRHSAADEQALQNMVGPLFDPRAKAFVHERIRLPDDGAEGQVKITEETPGRIVIHAKMKSEGLVVLSDSWHPGWTATVDDSPAEVLRTNVAIRSVMVPAGDHTLVMTYRPPSLSTGLLAAVSGISLALVHVVCFGRSARNSDTL